VADYEEWTENGRTMKRANWIAELTADMDFDCDRESEYGVLEANARLIAAAPDLLAACKGFMGKWASVEPLINGAFMQSVHGMAYTGPSLTPELNAIRAAIAKAEVA
jgi:hypothetical protein